MHLIDLINSKLELLRLEAKYTKRRHRRSAFVSDAVYVDGEYIYGTNNISSSSTSSNVSASSTSPKRDALPPVKFSSIEEEEDVDERQQAYEQERSAREAQMEMEREMERESHPQRELERENMDEEWDRKLKRLREREGYGYRWRVESGGPGVFYEEHEKARLEAEQQKRWSTIGRGLGKKEKRRSVAVVTGGVGDWDEYRQRDRGVSRAWEEDRL